MNDQDRKAANIAIGFSVFLFTIDLSIVNVGLPTIRTSLHTDYSTVQWVVLSYLLVIASFLMGAARLGDLHDKKKLFLGGLAVFTLGSGLCAIAPTIELLIAARALQGLGAVFISALGMAIVTAISPPEERGRNLGIVGGIIAIGVALGPTIGGVLLEVFAWPSIFLVNLPIGVGAGLAIWKKLPKLEPTGRPAPFDWPALAGLAILLTSFSMAVNAIQRNGFENPLTLGGLLLCLILLPLVIRRERRLEEQALIDTDLFHSTPLWLGLVLATTVFVVVAGSLFLMPFFLEEVIGFGPLKTGLLLAVSPLCGGLISPLAGSLADRYGERPISLIGLGLLATGCLLISTFHQSMSSLHYILCYAPFGLGIGTFQAPNNSAVMASAPKERQGTVSGLLSLSRVLGQSMGIPLAATLFYVLAGGGAGGEIEALGAPALVRAVHGTFLGAAALMLVAGIGAWRIWSGNHEESASKGRA